MAWTKANFAIDRNASPIQVGVDAGTSSTSFTQMGTIVGGAFYLPYTQVSGLFPYGKGTAGTGANATASGFTATNQALFLSGTLTGTGLGPYGLVSITDTATGSGSSFVPGFWVAHNIGASAGEGSRVALQPILRIDNPLTDVSNQGLFYISAFPQTYVTKNLGGASGGGNSRGDVYGGGSLVQLETGATYVHSVTGHENNVSVQTGASVDYKTIQTIIAVNSDAVAGSVFNAMTAYLTDSSATAKWALGVSFGSPLGLWPFSSSSTIVGTTAPSSGSRVANYGIDFSGVTFSTAFLKSTGFLVDGAGATSVAGLSSAGAVTTSGSVAGLIMSPRSGSGDNYQFANAAGSSVVLANATRTIATFDNSNDGSATFVGPVTGSRLVPGTTTVAALPAGVPVGSMMAVSDGAGALAWGATVTGGGSTKYLVWYNGSNWTVMGK